MKAYILTTKNSTRLKDGKIENYPSCLPEPEIFYGPTPEEGYKAPDWYKPMIHNKTYANDTTWCCLLGKLWLLKQHKEQYPDEDILILEDDVYFIPLFDTLYTDFMSKVPNDWEMIYIGGHHHKEPKEVVPDVLKCAFLYNTECFIIRNTAIQTVIDKLSEQNPKYCDHASDCLIASLMDTHPTYSPIPFFAGQRGGFSYIRRHNRNMKIHTSFRYTDILGRNACSSENDYLRYLKNHYSDFSVLDILHGGIGNCLYEYCYGKYLESLGVSVNYGFCDPHDDYALPFLNQLGINPVKVDNYHITRPTSREERLLDTLRNGEVTGYPFYADLRKYIKFPEIKTEDKIAVHIRRGDYLTHYAKFKYKWCMDLCKTDYYTTAYNIFKALNKPIIVFTDNYSQLPSTIKNLFKDAEINTDDPITAFYKMAACKYKIIANSTYSTWAAYANPDSVVVYPYNLPGNALPNWIGLNVSDDVY